jgi:cation/acetate symporter
LNLPDYWLWGISPEGIGFIGMLLNVIIGTLVSLMTPKPPTEVDLMIDNIRRP